MQAVDAEIISVHCAELLLAAQPAELRDLLRRGHKKEIRAFIQERGLLR